MHTAFRDAQFEPGPIRQRVLVWGQTAHELRVIADAATRLFVLRRRDAASVTSHDVDALVAVLSGVALATSQRHPPSTRERPCAKSPRNPQDSLTPRTS
jgi:hypothetical protein